LTGTCRAAYTFSGQDGVSALTPEAPQKNLRPSQEVVFREDLPGSYADNYQLIAGTGIESWSRCGGTTAIFNINSEARITPADTTLRGFMTVSRPMHSSAVQPAAAQSLTNGSC
jgi:hypothetical protein